MTSGAVSSNVLDDPRGDVFRVQRHAFTSPEVFAAERERIFERCWIYLGHDSEVAEPGDFRMRELGARRLLFVRGKDRLVRAFYNSCTHRGAEVCRERAGNANSFQCFYHGWTFANDGRLIGVPGDEAYGPGFSRESLALPQVPRLEQYRGFWFVCFDRNAVPLVEYLAGAVEYLDLVADQGESGMEIVGGTQSYAIHANWKLLVENSYDGYHAQITHARYMKWLASSGAVSMPKGKLANVARDLGNGHAVVEYAAPWGRPIAHWVPSFGAAAEPEIAAIRARLESRLGPERAARIASSSRNLGIFPNLVINDIMAITVRTFHPLAPGRMNVEAWSLAPCGEAVEHRKHRLENFLTFLGPAGFATPDDIEALEACQRGYHANPEAWNDLSREVGFEKPTVTGEHQMRVFWRRWLAQLEPSHGKLAEVRRVAAR
ncbi:MAG TPA: SRPBCC family protein [Myxococcota bacterium]|nr:SRPBCC family protein [Myxococcota bacterium]